MEILELKNTVLKKINGQAQQQNGEAKEEARRQINKKLFILNRGKNREVNTAVGTYGTIPKDLCIHINKVADKERKMQD